MNFDTISYSQLKRARVALSATFINKRVKLRSTAHKRSYNCAPVLANAYHAMLSKVKVT